MSCSVQKKIVEITILQVRLGLVLTKALKFPFQGGGYFGIGTYKVVEIPGNAQYSCENLVKSVCLGGEVFKNIVFRVRVDGRVVVREAFSGKKWTQLEERV